MSGARRARGTAQTVAANTFWYSLEMAVSALAALLTSIPVARVIGPRRLGYFAYVQWLTSVSGRLAMVGIPAATRKYMAEYLGRGEARIAWAIFRRSLRVQSYIALGVAAAGAALVWSWVEPSYRVCSLVLVMGVAPRMLAYIPSNANNAAENMRANFPGALLNSVVTVSLVNLSLWAGWGLTGVAASFMAGDTVELAVKMRMTRGWLRPAPGTGLPEELRRRLWRFSAQSLALMSVNMVVWDRSDLVLLKLLDKDIRQVTFFVLAFNVAERVLMVPRAFSTMIGISVMAEYGRDRAKLYRVASGAAKYALLVSAPVMLGLAAVSSPLIRVLYGAQYLPTIPVLWIGAALAVAKPLLAPAQSLMQAEERQGFLIRWSLVCAAANVGLDAALIPVWGARGAMLANGLAQGMAVIGVWVKAVRSFPLVAPVGAVGRILASGLAMGAPVWLLCGTPLPAAVQLGLGIPMGAALYAGMVRALGILEESDRGPLLRAAERLPGGLRGRAEGLVRWLTRAGAGAQ